MADVNQDPTFEGDGFDPTSRPAAWYLDAQLQHLAGIDRRLASVQRWVVLGGMLLVIATTISTVAVLIALVAAG